MFKLAISAGHYKYTSGKRCLKTLDPKETVIINVLEKELPFKGSRKLYNKESKNLFNVHKPLEVIQYLENISLLFFNILKFGGILILMIECGRFIYKRKEIYSIKKRIINEI